MTDQPNDQPKAQPAPAPEPAPKPEPTPQPEPAPQPRLLSTAVLLVERWWQDWFPSSPVSRDTAAWNHAYQAKEDLKKSVYQIVEGKSSKFKVKVKKAVF